MKAWKRLSSKIVLDNDYVKVSQDDVILGNNVEVQDFYKITIKDAVIIAALADEGKILLKNEYRYCYEKELIELPAGCIENGETPLEAAKRELLEETGYASEHWTNLGATVESSSKLTNLMHVFLAEDCKKIAKPHFDKTEELETSLVTLKEAVELVMNNQICCNSSSTAILKVARMKGIE